MPHYIDQTFIAWITLTEGERIGWAPAGLHQWDWCSERSQLWWTCVLSCILVLGIGAVYLQNQSGNYRVLIHHPLVFHLPPEGCGCNIWCILSGISMTQRDLLYIDFFILKTHQLIWGESTKGECFTGSYSHCWGGDGTSSYKAKTPLSEIDPGDVASFIETEKHNLAAANQDAQDARRRINAVKPKKKKGKKVESNPGSESGSWRG